jgi:hypothetical protein
MSGLTSLVANSLAVSMDAAEDICTTSSIRSEEVRRGKFKHEEERHDDVAT